MWNAARESVVAAGGLTPQANCGTLGRCSPGSVPRLSGSMSPQYEFVVSRRPALLLAAAALVCVSCGSPQKQPAAGPASAPSVAAVSVDCTVQASALPAGATRIYIALREGVDGTGQSADDARDGSTAARFDTILRCYAEGCSVPPGTGKRIPITQDLIVCLAPGTFQTMGNYDAIINVPHLTQQGFTLGKGWKIHGNGPAFTTLQLSAFLPITDPGNLQGLPVGTGVGVVLSTTSHSASGVEISDLTIDGNYPALKQIAQENGIFALNIDAIHLWSALGGNWVHNVNVINAAGEIGALNGIWETFAVWIVSAMPNSTPADSKGNVIENVTMSQFGGGSGTAIAIANSEAEVRNNSVTGYLIGYGGWSMGQVHFKNNVATDTTYGFNVDSLSNDGASIESNQINGPRSYGMVIGGGGTYNNLTISGNTISLKDPRSSALLFQGNVMNSTIAGNSFLAEPSAAGAVAIRNFSNGATAGANGSNVYQSNKIDSSLRVVFEAPSQRLSNCAFGNRDEQGRPRGDLPDTQSVPCVATAPVAAPR
jgi:hypothetical protein